MQNAIYCLDCKTIISSSFRHDFQECRCEQPVAVSGGLSYFRRVGPEEKYIDLAELDYDTFVKFVGHEQFRDSFIVEHLALRERLRVSGGDYKSDALTLHEWAKKWIPDTYKSLNEGVNIRFISEVERKIALDSILRIVKSELQSRWMPMEEEHG